LAADTEAFHGHFAKARDLSRQAEAAAERDGVNEVALKYQAWAAWREAEVGNLDRARQWLPSAATPADSRFLRSVVAVALAKVGHHEAAEKLADEIGRKYPLNTAVQTEVRPLVRSMIELQKGNAANAIETLQPALATDSAFSDLNTMEPSYVRGLAYLKLGDGEKAAAQFQNMLDHPGLVGNFVIGALAHLQLARTYEMMGKHEEALTKYQDFLALWKDADPDIPIYRQAKAEYAKLK
jgi:tetratricopeptide (TPR) repeat protein